MPIYLIRHGQSSFNAAHRDGEPDPMLFDARLTDLGRAQARAARDQVAQLGIAGIISSPLTRAIETSRLIFGDDAPIRIMAEHRENLYSSCDVGRSPRELQAEFANLDFSHLDDVWWHQGPENEDGIPVEPEAVFSERLEAFARLLEHITPRPLAIVGHGEMFRALSGVSFENCQIHRYC